MFSSLWSALFGKCFIGSVLRRDQKPLPAVQRLEGRQMLSAITIVVDHLPGETVFPQAKDVSLLQAHAIKGHPKITSISMTPLPGADVNALTNLKLMIGNTVVATDMNANDGVFLALSRKEQCLKGDITMTGDISPDAVDQAIIGFQMPELTLRNHHQHLTVTGGPNPIYRVSTATDLAVTIGGSKEMTPQKNGIFSVTVENKGPNPTGYPMQIAVRIPDGMLWDPDSSPGWEPDSFGGTSTVYYNVSNIPSCGTFTAQPLVLSVDTFFTQNVEVKLGAYIDFLNDIDYTDNQASMNVTLKSLP